MKMKIIDRIRAKRYEKEAKINEGQAKVFDECPYKDEPQEHPHPFASGNLLDMSNAFGHVNATLNRDMPYKREAGVSCANPDSGVHHTVVENGTRDDALNQLRMEMGKEVCATCPLNPSNKK